METRTEIRHSLTFEFSFFRAVACSNWRHVCVYESKTKKLELRDVTLGLPRWKAVHVTGGGQRGAELRDDYYGRVSSSRRLPTGWGRRSGSSTPELQSIVIKRARRNVVRKEKPRRPDSSSGRIYPSPSPIRLSQTVL